MKKYLKTGHNENTVKYLKGYFNKFYDNDDDEDEEESEI